MFTQQLYINKEKPISCPLNGMYDKYLEFFLDKKQVKACNLDSKEFLDLENKIVDYLKKYGWQLRKKN